MNKRNVTYLGGPIFDGERLLDGHAARFEDTDWHQIEWLYRTLLQFDGSPVVRLNMAVATSYAQNPKAALAILAELAEDLPRYQPYFAAKADFLARDGQSGAAMEAYDQAIALCQNRSEAMFLQKRKSQLDVG